MRTLAKPQKLKPQGDEKKDHKQQPSKKLTKTVFHSPFRYKMSPFPHADRPSTSKTQKLCSPPS
jgi:hypothetical protein